MAQFLTDEWLEQAKAIREEYRGKAGAPPHVVKMNLNIKECPDEVGSGGVMEAHMDSTGGEMEMDTGHIEDPQLTVTLPYDIAKAILVEGNPQAGMQAFMSGQIQVTGDMTKLMAMQSGAIDPVQAEIASKIQAITD
ncbi:SCP-2 sterol transfer family protein [Iamia sp. SCSIO 61187]|uniref:SCP2 sterol-binding domain-containing protein n=1 Tax=Iamia sp. SCSIO 61187 TaxID=2722752 RepID=UPI001C627DBF|nr:SCP2 sterol-binding domain-containing protein [Iamia sp. SCSIO 61187]QYG94558.1 SCP-2 sterol transfer family protein [Iamia sp. SCSIO 61187]